MKSSIVLTYNFNALNPVLPYQDMLNIEDYFMTYNNSKDNAGMEVLCDDDTLRDALQSLGDSERLEIKLCPKKLHNQTAVVDRFQNPAVPPVRFQQHEEPNVSPRRSSLSKPSSVRSSELSHSKDTKHPLLPDPTTFASVGPTQPLSSERRHSVVDHRVAQFSPSPPISAERRHSIADTSNIPVIKPTVIRWGMRRHSEQPLFHSTHNYQSNDIAASIKRTIHQESISDEMLRIASRKDSGVDLEPTRKKLRVMASDQSLARRRSSMGSDNDSPIQNIDGSANIHDRHPLFPKSRYRWNSDNDSHSDQEQRLNGVPIPTKLSLSGPDRTPTSPYTITLPGITSLTSDADQNSSPLLAPINSQSPREKFGPPTPSTSGSESTSSTASPSPTMSVALRMSQKRATRSDKGGHHQRRVGNPEYGGDFLCQEIVDQSTGRICGQTFRRSYDLSRHQTIHLKNRPFCYCTHCGKKFTRMDALRRHERVQGHRNSRKASNNEMSQHIVAN
ncbi:hypothetical protein NQZ79_g5755 [Umbelopsis isabellina]|nr:hypothetical protein NQZ79_g5755 [Umbelopsis isabellina]